MRRGERLCRSHCRSGSSDVLHCAARWRSRIGLPHHFDEAHRGSQWIAQLVKEERPKRTSESHSITRVTDAPSRTHPQASHAATHIHTHTYTHIHTHTRTHAHTQCVTHTNTRTHTPKHTHTHYGVPCRVSSCYRLSRGRRLRQQPECQQNERNKLACGYDRNAPCQRLGQSRSSRRVNRGCCWHNVQQQRIV